MIDKNEMKMTELLCSKLCHDLISPIGAINNGLEFLQDESSEMANEASKLIDTSAKQAADRLAYFRLAFGVGGSDDLIAFKTVVELIEKFAIEKKIDVDWLGDDTLLQSNVEKFNGKLLLNLVLMASDCLPRGGRIEFSFEGNSRNPDFTASINGDKCNLRDDVKSGLDEQISADSLTVRNILAYYCRKLAKNCEKTLKLADESPPLIVFKVS